MFLTRNSCLLTLLSQLNYFMGRLVRATCTVHLISDPDQPGGKRMYHYKREAKSLMH